MLSIDRVAESNQIFLSAWDAMVGDAPGFERLRGGLFEVSWSGLPVTFFNLALASRKPESASELELALNEVVAWTAERKQPWLLGICHQTMGDMMPEAERLLAAAGFGSIMGLAGMDAAEVVPSGRPTPPAPALTESEPGIGSKTLRVNEAAYGMTFAEPDSLPMETAGWWRIPDRMVTVLEVDGSPVSSAAVFNVAGLRYVAMVATHPSGQRQGYADAAMRDVLDRALAAGGGKRTYLHATAAGCPVYERMGYAVTANYTLYALGGH